MKTVQSPTFDQINTYAQKHNRTNFSNFEQYHCITGNTISNFIISYINDTSLVLSFENDKILDCIYQWAERNTANNYNDLLLWFSRDCTAIDEYIENFGYCPNMDIIEIIQAAYRSTLEQSMIIALQTIEKIITYNLEDGL